MPTVNDGSQEAAGGSLTPPIVPTICALARSMTPLIALTACVSRPLGFEQDCSSQPCENPDLVCVETTNRDFTGNADAICKLPCAGNADCPQRTCQEPGGVSWVDGFLATTDTASPFDPVCVKDPTGRGFFCAEDCLEP